MTRQEVELLLARLELDVQRLTRHPEPANNELWPCHECDTPGVRNLGTDGYCSVHLHALYATFGPEAWVDGGVGLQDGPLRPEYGPLEADLRCCCCDATWTGIPGDACWWCQRAIDIQLEHQTQLDRKAVA